MSEDIELNVEPNFFERHPVSRFSENSRNLDETFNVNLPNLDKDSCVLSIGSCFAANIRKHLSLLGVKVNDLTFFDDQITTTTTVKEYFDWITFESNDEPGFLYKKDGYVKIGKIEGNSLEETRKKLNNSLKISDCIVITYGLSESWQHKETKKNIWKWPGKEKSDDYELKLLSAKENCFNIDQTITLLRKHNQKAVVILTLSPVPLHSTFRKDFNVNIANCASKSRLRSGLDEFFILNSDKKVFYWPSYEFITQHPDPWEDDKRHVKDDIISSIMNSFTNKINLTSK
jgi:hypothetical protein